MIFPNDFFKFLKNHQILLKTGSRPCLLTAKGARIPKSVPSHKSPPQYDKREYEIPKCWEHKMKSQNVGNMLDRKNIAGEK